MSSAFIQAAVILLREGLEAMLVIAALAGYLRKAGAAHRVGALYGGALVAVGASFIAAWLFAVFNSGDHSDVLEGVIILFAAALMLYVSGWLMVKQDPRGWQDYLAHKADQRAGAGHGVGGRRAGLPRRVPRGRRNRAVHQRAGEDRRRLERGAVRRPRGGDGRSRRAVLFHQHDRAEASAAAAVHHHLRLPVRDGDQVHRRGRAGIPGAGDHHGHRGQGHVPSSPRSGSIRAWKRCRSSCWSFCSRSRPIRCSSATAA